jgi:peptidyl-prolyl cis-trans isomerase D
MVKREKLLKSKWYRVVLWLLTLSMFSGGIVAFLQIIFKGGTGVGLPIIMTINNHDITQRQFDFKLAQEMERIALLQQQYGRQAESIFKLLGLDNPQEMAIKSLIQEELLNQVANKMNLQLAQEYVIRKLQDPSAVIHDLRDVIPFQVMDQRGVINMMALQIILERRGLTLADFEKQIEKALERKLVADLVGASIYVSFQELRNYYESNFLARKYDILRFPFDQYLKKVKNEPLTDKEVEEYFIAQNKASKRYWMPEKRSGSVWIFSPEKYALKISDKKIDSYYKANKFKEFLETPVQVKVRRILIKIEEGDNVAAIEQKARNIKEQLDKDPSLFAQLAKEQSDDQESASQGGLIDFFKRGQGQYDPAFERAAFRLKKDGDISDIVATREGLMIVQRVARKAANYKPLEKVHDQIKKLLLERKFKDLFNRDAQRIIDQMKKDKGIFNAFVQEKGANLNTLKNATRDNSQLMQKLFKTNKGHWAYFINENGNGVILTVNEIDKSSEPKLQSVKSQVENDLYKQKARRAVEESLEKAKKLAGSQSLDKVKEQFKTELIATDWLKQEDEKSLQVLLKNGIPVSELFVSDKVGSLTTALAEGSGYLAKLESIEPFSQSVFEDKRSDILKDLVTEKKGLVIRGFVASLYKNAKIKAIEERQNVGPQIPLDDLMF